MSAPTPPSPERPDGADGEAVEGSGLTHLDQDGRARMVDVAGKPETHRVAVARALVRMAPSTAALVADGGLPKGDALPVVRLAGVQAAKRTAELIPLCHPVRLTQVDVDVRLDVQAGVATIDATAVAFDRTGVEMEAMTAASVAALTLYDLTKAVQRDVVVEAVRLLEKRGGRSGTWRAED